MIADNLVVNGIIKATSKVEVNNLTVNQINGISGDEIAQLSGTTDNVQNQIDTLATSYDESIKASTEFKAGVANTVNSLSDEPSLNSESTLEQYVTAISLLGGKNYKGRLTASDDLDNVSDDGFYDIVSTDQPAHIPSDCGDTNACVEVFNLPEIETIYQRYHRFQGGVFTYSRRKFNGAWSDWVAYTFGVKGNAETSYRSGNVNITPENIGAMSNSPYVIEFKGDTNYHNGGVLDFHFDQSNTDYTSRIIEDASGQININGVKFKSGTVTGTLSGNASSAYKNYLPRVAKSCAYQPGECTGIWEEFVAGDSYSLPTNAWYHIFTGQGADANYNTQLALGMTTTNIAYRNRGAGGWGSWQTVLTSGNYKSYCTPANIGAAASSHTHSGYMPNPWANGTLYLIGDDVYMGDNNVAGCLVIKGNNGDSGIQFNPYSGSTPQKISINGSGLMSITGNLNVGAMTVSGRVFNDCDDEGILISPASNGWSALTLGTTNGRRSYFAMSSSDAPIWRYSSDGNTNWVITHPCKSGTIALTSDLNTLKSNFQAGVDSIYNAIVAQGTTPASKSLSDVTASISKLGGYKCKNWIEFAYSEQQAPCFKLLDGTETLSNNQWIDAATPNHTSYYLKHFDDLIGKISSSSFAICRVTSPSDIKRTNGYINYIPSFSYLKDITIFATSYSTNGYCTIEFGNKGMSTQLFQNRNPVLYGYWADGNKSPNNGSSASTLFQPIIFGIDVNGNVKVHFRYEGSNILAFLGELAFEFWVFYK